MCFPGGEVVAAGPQRVLYDDIIGTPYRHPHGAPFARSAAMLKDGDTVELVPEHAPAGATANGSPTVGAYFDGVKVGHLSPQLTDQLGELLHRCGVLTAKVTRVLVSSTPVPMAVFVGIAISLPEM